MDAHHLAKLYTQPMTEISIKWDAGIQRDLSLISLALGEQIPMKERPFLVESRIYLTSMMRYRSTDNTALRISRRQMNL